MANPEPLVAFLLLWVACLLLRRTHAILGRARRASRERELLELRILHERLKRALVSSPVSFLLLWIACLWLRRTHAILGRARRASRKRELLELRILHERLKRAPGSSPVSFLLLSIACLRLRRTHAILGRARRASRERELLELRILHEQLKRAPISSVVHPQPLCLQLRTCIVQSSRLSAHVRMADPVRSGFKPPREVDCAQCTFSVDATNAS